MFGCFGWLRGGVCLDWAEQMCGKCADKMCNNREFTDLANSGLGVRKAGHFSLEVQQRSTSDGQRMKVVSFLRKPISWSS